MKHPFRFSILPYFTMGAGGLGLALRVWLFSATDEKGLLPAGHPADAALYILTALVLGVLFLSVRNQGAGKGTPAFLDIPAHLIAGICLLLTSSLALLAADKGLTTGAAIVGLIGGAALLGIAVLSWKKKAVPYLLPALLTVSLMLHTVAQCRVWMAEPQLQAYFFPLMALIFAILTAYHRTTLEAGQGKPDLLAFFSQGALFFCCLCLNTDHWILYLGLAFWAAVQLIPCYPTPKEA